MRCPRRGLTLLEMLVALAIVAVLMSLALPSFGNMFSAHSRQSRTALTPMCPPSVFNPPSQSAAKRYKVTGSGKVMARHSGKQHMNEKKNRNRKRRLSKAHAVSESDYNNVIGCLPYAKIQKH